jgi:N-acetylglucosaminyl-diphospho-decaprenol L-rhamnosyltransferase
VGGRISVIVVAYESGSEIGPCLDAALAQEVRGYDLEVVVVDNASSDDSVARVAAFGDRVTVIAQDTNTGYAAGCNVAAEASSGELLLLLNPDCVMDPGCLAALVSHLTETPGAGCAAALLRYPDGRPQRFARRELTLGQVAWGLTEVGGRIDRRFRGGRGLRHRQYADLFDAGITSPVSVDCPAAACVLVWRRLLRGRLFDPAFPLVFNDADLYRRLRQRGYRAHVVPAATAVHGQGTSLKRVPSPRMRAEFVASMQRYAAGQHGLWWRAALWSMLLLDGLGSVLLGILGGRRNRMRARIAAKGTLGGLGVPWMAKPWLTRVPRMQPRPRVAARRLGSRVRPVLRNTSRRYRRRAFLMRLRASAWLMAARVDVVVDPSADVGRGIVLEIRPRSANRLRIEAGARVQRHVVLRLDGDLHVGPYCELRDGAVINVHGFLELQGRNVVCRGVMVHADAHQVWEWGATAAEYAGVSDNVHALDGSSLHFYDLPVVVRPIRLGSNAFVGAHAFVNAGVTVGRNAVVGANSVVTKDVPPGVLVAGVPARVIRHLDGEGIEA